MGGVEEAKILKIKQNMPQRKFYLYKWALLLEFLEPVQSFHASLFNQNGKEEELPLYERLSRPGYRRDEQLSELFEDSH